MKVEIQEKELTIIVPCYNEGINVDFLHAEIVNLFSGSKNSIEIVFIDDGSSDDTLEVMKEIALKSIFKIKIISFSRNFGKEAAILAGLQESTGKYTIIIDADLQQNPKYILEMKKILDENPEIDVVAAYPEKRKENFFKRLAKKTFYRLMSKLSEVELKDSVSDFRIFRRNVLESMLSLSEKHRFTKGIFAWVGFNTYYYPYHVEKRATGKSKWRFKSLFAYAMDGLVDFSKKPLLVAVYVGLFLMIVSSIIAIVLLCMNIISGTVVSGLIWIAILITEIGGCILISNGIIGYYLYKTFTEVKNRPIYIVRKRFENEKGM